MTWVERVQEAISTRRVSIFLKALAVFCLVGALSHLAGILGLVGPARVSKPLLFRIADSVLLPTNLVLAWGLWRNRAWAVFAWLAAMLFLQVIPILFLLLTDAFATDPMQQRAFYGLLAGNATLLALFLLLLPRKK
jgi:hypothetical protein